MTRKKVSLRQLAESIGLNHLEATELLRRIAGAVDNEDEETIVITQQVGTFYLQKRKATKRTLNGVVYDQPARNVIQLDPPDRRATLQEPEDGRTETLQTVVPLFRFPGDDFDRTGSLLFRVPDIQIAFSQPRELVTSVTLVTGSILGTGTIGGIDVGVPVDDFIREIGDPIERRVLLPEFEQLGTIVLVPFIVRPHEGDLSDIIIPTVTVEVTLQDNPDVSFLDDIE